MRKFGLIAGMVALFSGALVTFAACSGPIDESCVSDEDCADDEVCHTAEAECVVECTEEPDNCRDDEVCEELGNDGTKACLADDGGDAGGTDAGMDAGDANMTDGGGCSLGDCPDGEACNEDTGMCESQYELKYIQIKDTSDAACEDNDPGANLYAAKLMDSEANTLGWGYSVEYSGGAVAENNTHTQDGTVFAGSMPDLMEWGDENALCPTPQNGEKHREDSVVALGCGGAIVLSFHDDNGDPVALEEGHKIQISEYGEQCGGSSFGTSVSVCTSQNASNDILASWDSDAGTFATCDTAEVASGLGQYTFTIGSLPEEDDGS